MSDNSSNWRDKHVQIFGLLHKKATSLRFSPKMSRTIDRALEVLSVFLFAFVAMWMELCCIIFMGFLAVSSQTWWFLVIIVHKYFHNQIQVKCGIIGKLIVIWYITHWYNDYDSPEHGRKGQGCVKMTESVLRFLSSIFSFFHNSGLNLFETVPGWDTLRTIFQ